MNVELTFDICLQDNVRCCDTFRPRIPRAPRQQPAHHWYFSFLCCSVLQCFAVCCSVLQCVAVRCSVLQCVAVCCSVLQCVAVCCSVLQCVVVCCSVLQCVRGQQPAHHWYFSFLCRNVLQCAAVCCIVLQCAAVCCSVLQCAAECCRVTENRSSKPPSLLKRRASRCSAHEQALPPRVK